MGKKKTKTSQQAAATNLNPEAEALKDLGNKEFQSQNFSLAINHYTSAITTASSSS